MIYNDREIYVYVYVIGLVKKNYLLLKFADGNLYYLRHPTKGIGTFDSKSTDCRNFFDLKIH